jgi:hypothetical protein
MKEDKKFLDKITELDNLRLITFFISGVVYFFASIYEENHTVFEALIDTITNYGRILLIGSLAYCFTLILYRKNRDLTTSEKFVMVGSAIFMFIHAIALGYEYEFFSILKYLGISIIFGLVISVMIGLIAPRLK